MLLTIQQVADRLQLSKATVRNRIKEGKLKAIKLVTTHFELKNRTQSYKKFSSVIEGVYNDTNQTPSRI